MKLYLSKTEMSPVIFSLLCCFAHSVPLVPSHRRVSPWPGFGHPDFVPPPSPRERSYANDWVLGGTDCLVLESKILPALPTEPRAESSEPQCGLSQYDEGYDDLGAAPQQEDEDDDDRIVGGKTTRRSRYPWIVALTLNRGFQFCAGTIINSKYVLTAAHCIAWGRGALNISIHVGAHDIKVQHDKEIRRVEKLKIHSKYNPITSDFDVALIELDQEIKFSKTALPICLAEQGQDFTGANVVVAGWGNTRSHGRRSNVLRAVDVTVISNDECNTKYKKSATVTETMLCAGHPQGGKDACQGDSGGPLIAKVPGDDARDGGSGRWTQLGVVSWGRGCALRQYPGVYASVAYFREWIDRHSQL